MKKIYYSFLLTLMIPIVAMQQGKMIEFTTIIFNSNGKTFTVLNPSTNSIVYPEFAPFIAEMQNRQPVNVLGYATAVRMKNSSCVPEIQLEQQLALIRVYNKQFGPY